jgi:DNA/RNA-binding domain of Phe-tRNA-synthetase-like protein
MIEAVGSFAPASYAACAPMLTIEPHPLLDAAAFVTTFPAPLEGLAPSEEIRRLMSLEAPAPLRADDAVRAAIRDMLRHGGYKPTGRGKPSSEYLIRAVTDGALGSINTAVDACNVASLHSGLPISVVDIDRARPPFRIAIAPPGATYVFNASGQTIDLEGLVCLFDEEGPSANAVKDAQRTKTHAGTVRTLSIVWGSTALPGRAEKAASWYRSLLEGAGAVTEDAR